VGALLSASELPWVLQSRVRGQASREGGGLGWAGLGWPAGSLTGCVCLGLAGQHLRDGREEKLNNAIEGE